MVEQCGPTPDPITVRHSFLLWAIPPSLPAPRNSNTPKTRCFMPQHDEVEILLVEDNADDVELCLHALRKEKLSNKIHVARDGQEALDFLFGRDPQHLLPRLILLDLKLPKVDGIQVLREVKRNTTTKTLPVVILTSSREERDLVESYELGVNSYLQKPVDFDEFRSMVKQIGFYWMVVNQTAPNGRTMGVRTS